MPSCDFCNNDKQACYFVLGQLTLCGNCHGKVTRFIIKNKNMIKRICISRIDNIIPVVS